MTRIGFLLSAVLSLAIGHVRPAQAKTIRRTVDVLVIGGGMAGCFAAIHAARRGARVIVAEKGATIRSGAAGGGIAGRRTYAHARGDVLGAGRPGCRR